MIRLDLVLPSLTSLETEISTYVFDHYVNTQMKQMVETNCPLLCTWNGVNVKEVAKKAGARNWAQHLTFPETGWTRPGDEAESGDSDFDSQSSSDFGF